jgi:hypothetical protein
VAKLVSIIFSHSILLLRLRCSDFWYIWLGQGGWSYCATLFIHKIIFVIINFNSFWMSLLIFLTKEKMDGVLVFGTILILFLILSASVARVMFWVGDVWFLWPPHCFLELTIIAFYQTNLIRRIRPYKPITFCSCRFAFTFIFNN